MQRPKKSSDVKVLPYFEDEDGVWVQVHPGPSKLFRGKQLHQVEILLDVMIGKGKYQLHEDETLSGQVRGEDKFD